MSVRADTNIFSYCEAHQCLTCLVGMHRLADLEVVFRCWFTKFAIWGIQAFIDLVNVTLITREKQQNDERADDGVEGSKRQRKCQGSDKSGCSPLATYLYTYNNNQSNLRHEMLLHVVRRHKRSGLSERSTYLICRREPEVWRGELLCFRDNNETSETSKYLHLAMRVQCHSIDLTFGTHDCCFVFATKTKLMR
jgi:hypothetical protein